MHITIPGSATEVPISLPSNTFDHCAGQADDPGNIIDISAIGASIQAVLPN